MSQRPHTPVVLEPEYIEGFRQIYEEKIVFNKTLGLKLVKVTPEVNNKAVLIVGKGQGPMVLNGSTMPAGDAVAPATALGQTALKSGHSSEFSRLPKAGTECERAHHSAVKKAPKNITSEKMNQLMLQR
jgi:hypothetical protein